MKTLVRLAAALLFPIAANAGVLETEVTPEMAEMGCTARLSGVLETGDLDRIRPFLETPLTEGWGNPGSDNAMLFRNFTPATDYGEGFFSHRLCLNSPGGSLAEAMRIVDYFREEASHTRGGVQTAIARGDRCEGSCAYVFFAGRFVRFSGNGYYEGRSNALLHPNGRLGLHAPTLPINDESSYSAEDVRAIWAVGMQAASELSRQIASGNIFLSGTLFSEILTRPPGEMLTIDTVAQAVQWRIEVEPSPIHAGRYDYDFEVFAESLCRNAALLTPDFVTLEPAAAGITLVQDAEENVRSQGGFVDTRSGREYSCGLEAFEWNNLQIDLQIMPEDWVMRRLRWNGSCGGAVTFEPVDPDSCYDCALDIDAPCLAVFPPETRLADLLNGAN